ncbi:GTPase IMAP family member 5-like [Mytilus galloprovincialis]|uniref:GTPase IMAP family member 5-like n=1 Tax=Mytilus galloprovincialis TaxID=29158 RepID=UPI003F7B40A9
MKYDEPPGHHQDSSLESPKKTEVITEESGVKPHIGVTNHDQSISLDTSSDEESVIEDQLKSRRKELEEEKKLEMKKKEKKARKQKKAGHSDLGSNADDLSAGPSGATSNAENVTDNPNTDDGTKKTILIDAPINLADELRVVVIGRTGAGISSVANNILGKPAFESAMSMSSKTTKSEKGRSEVAGRRLLVIDTPGMYNNRLWNINIYKELINAMHMTSPGPHAIIFTIQVGRDFREDYKSFSNLIHIFGIEVWKYLIVVFTFKEKLDLDGSSEEEYVNGLSDYFKKKVLENCDDRKLFVTNVKDGNQLYNIHHSLFSCISEMQNRRRQEHDDLYLDITQSCFRVKKTFFMLLQF